MKRVYKGFRLIDGTVDNSKCPHLHAVDDNDSINCQTCGRVILSVDQQAAINGMTEGGPSWGNVPVDYFLGGKSK